MILILFYGLLFFVVWLPEKVSGGMKILIFLVLFFSLGWLLDSRDEKQKRELREREEAKREEQRRQLEQSVKYNRLCEMLKELKPYSTSISLTLNSLNEFRAYNKTVALDVAYGEICAKYQFFADSHFLDRFYAVTALPANASDYVRRKEEEVYQLVDKAVHTPVRVVWIYTSPAGRNRYYDAADITFAELQEYKRHRNLRQQDTMEQYRREIERQMITPGLRYDIMRRDNFRCQICGRTAQDGVKLEVDHKKPIAKGGRTEPNNLWTLCWDCNRGKGAKYDLE
ncbi:MAG: HNH endonuclease [Synergistaceae bacterium]|nr:HNH endonuclease [Synergistaceae bacterium]